MSKIQCKLCLSYDIEVVDTIKAEELALAYRRFTNRSFLYLLKEDISLYSCRKCSLLFYEPSVVGDELFYSTLQEFEWYYLPNKYEYDYTLRYLKGCERILEVGAGEGAFAYFLPNRNYTGLEYSKTAIKMAKKNGINLLRESIEEHSTKRPEYYDAILSFQVLEHVLEPKIFLDSQVKALKKGGKLFISVPSEDSFIKKTTNLILNMPPHHLTRWTDRALYQIADEFSLELIHIHHEPLQRIHYAWYLSCFIQNIFIRPRLLASGLKRQLLEYFSNRMAMLTAWSLFLLPKSWKPNGHTVIAIYKKNN